MAQRRRVHTRRDRDRSAATVICDLDGVVWLEGAPIDGAVDAIADLRHCGAEVIFVTNNSTVRSSDHERILIDLGIDADGAVISSADAAAACVDAGQRVMVVGGIGIRAAVHQRGAIVVEAAQGDAASADVVIVGLDRDLRYERHVAATQAIRGGARFIATNTDPTLPTPLGPVPGAGAIVGAISIASGRDPEIAGKPGAAIASLIESRLGDRFDPLHAVVIGDRVSTDGVLAVRLGCRFVLIDDGSDRRSARDTGDGVDVWRRFGSLHDAMVALRSFVED